ncbi:MAG: hypothetical protein ACR2HG_04945 [Pyrinomonadaceae bacterium]
MIPLQTTQISTSSSKSIANQRVVKSEKQSQSFEVSLFNNKKDNQPEFHQKSWKEFIELCKEPEIRAIKDGAAFSPATFNGTRSKENVESVSMLVLDYDREADWESDLDVWKNLNLTFAAYTTHSHLQITRDHPNAEQRFRIVIPLIDSIPKQLYPALWQWAYQKTKNKIDCAARDESRLYYLPAKASADAPYDYYIHDGDLLDWQKFALNEVIAESISTTSKPQVKNPEHSAFLSNGKDYAFTLNANATANDDKKNDLWNIEPKALLSYERKRVDLKDQSASSYDLSLANYCVQAGWTDQEIVNLLIESRRKNGDDLKLRYDYYQRTIAKVREVQTIQPSESIEDDSNADEKRQNAINKLKDSLKVPNLVSIIQRGTSNSVYELKLSDNSHIVLGSSSEVRQQSKVADRLFDAGIILDKFSSEKWRDNVLTTIREAVEIVETQTDAEELHGYVSNYFNMNGYRNDYWDNRNGINLNCEDKEELVKDISRIRSRGFYDYATGQAYLPLQTFLQFLNNTSGKRWTQREITTLLSRYGFVNRQKGIRYSTESGETEVYNAGRFWISPIKYLNPQLEWRVSDFLCN